MASLSALAPVFAFIGVILFVMLMVLPKVILGLLAVAAIAYLLHRQDRKDAIHRLTQSTMPAVTEVQGRSIDFGEISILRATPVSQLTRMESLPAATLEAQPTPSHKRPTPVSGAELDQILSSLLGVDVPSCQVSRKGLQRLRLRVCGKKGSLVRSLSAASTRESQQMRPAKQRRPSLSDLNAQIEAASTALATLDALLTKKTL